MASIDLKNVSKSFETIEVLKDINLSIKNGEFVVLVGPSGCGKSTLLRIISGLEYPDTGKIIIDNLDHTHKIPSERKLSMVFQSYALYPHMNVFDNIGFSLKTKGIDKSILVKKINKVSKILKLNHLLNRLPKELSGGQRQRVAIGRAIIREPKAFLFDEPLSNLDASLRVDMRLEISKLHQQLGITTVYVTHDQVEAMTLADKIVVIDKGKIIQVGTPQQLFKNPINLFVAEFIGTPKMNILDCFVKDQNIYIKGKKNIKTNIQCSNNQLSKIGFRPEIAKICDQSKGVFSGIIKFCEYLGSEQLLYLDCQIENKFIVIKVSPNTQINVNKKIGIKIEKKDLHFFSKDDSTI